MEKLKFFRNFLVVITVGFFCSAYIALGDEFFTELYLGLVAGLLAFFEAFGSVLQIVVKAGMIWWGAILLKSFDEIISPWPPRLLVKLIVAYFQVHFVVIILRWASGY